MLSTTRLRVYLFITGTAVQGKAGSWIVKYNAQNAPKTLFRGLKSKKNFWGGGSGGEGDTPSPHPPPSAPSAPRFSAPTAPRSSALSAPRFSAPTAPRLVVPPLVFLNSTTGAKLQSNHHQQTNTQFFYRPDALPVSQPTVSKHWRENITFYWLAYPNLTWGSPDFVFDH